MSRETNILPVVNQSERRKLDSGIASETVYVEQIFCICAISPLKALGFNRREKCLKMAVGILN